jgi:hypothetical protein
MPATDRRQMTRPESRGRLSSGMRLGPSQMTDFIGAGGMGEVYRARDTHRRARRCELRREPLGAQLPAQFPARPVDAV